ncbi:hypothetical protein AURDEDRAFT_163850 [Auricularia subglabra TFB-10046 SS5]|nr:hypothetical protein AURDEDRAFT_163850 [Auricularia subglabra TFB-10046 SS5]
MLADEHDGGVIGLERADTVDLDVAPGGGGNRQEALSAVKQRRLDRDERYLIPAPWCVSVSGKRARQWRISMTVAGSAAMATISYRSVGALEDVEDDLPVHAPCRRPRDARHPPIRLVTPLHVPVHPVLTASPDVVPASAESLHILNVAHLHASLYSRPFNIPSGSQVLPTTPPVAGPSTPTTARPTHRQATAIPPSPAKSIASQSSPSRNGRPATLTHPANLRTKERTRNTFRIYLKAYMCAPADVIVQGEGAAFGQPRPKECGPQQADVSALSTLPSHSQLPDRSDDLERTPTQRTRRREAPQPPPSGADVGFTRAFFERVPELAQLAAAVARVERHMRRDKAAAQADRPHTRDEKEAADARAARAIFIDALRKLCEQGAIVLHEGSVWSFDGDAGIVAEPWSGAHDAYVPVTPELLRGPVQEVMASYRRRRLTPEEVTKYLKGRDDRWRCLSAWDRLMET